MRHYIIIEKTFWSSRGHTLCSGTLFCPDGSVEPLTGDAIYFAGKKRIAEIEVPDKKTETRVMDAEHIYYLLPLLHRGDVQISFESVRVRTKKDL